MFCVCFQVAEEAVCSLAHDSALAMVERVVIKAVLKECNSFNQKKPEVGVGTARFLQWYKGDLPEHVCLLALSKSFQNTDRCYL